MADEPKTLRDDELLFRQVNPGWVRDGRVSSQAFRPTRKDAGLLSVDRASLANAESSFRLFTEGLRRPSAGTWAVTVQECDEQSLPVIEDPLTSPPEVVANPAHAVISYKDVSSNQQVESKSQALARCARERGRLFPTPEVKSA
jgi:hypothetical protein